MHCLVDLYSMQAITLRVSQLCESRVFDLRRQLEEISMGNLIIPVYILFTALHESGVMMEDVLTMQVSDNTLSPSRLLVVW